MPPKAKPPHDSDSYFFPPVNSVVIKTTNFRGYSPEWDKENVPFGIVLESSVYKQTCVVRWFYKNRKPRDTNTPGVLKKYWRAIPPT